MWIGDPPSCMDGFESRQGVQTRRGQRVQASGITKVGELVMPSQLRTIEQAREFALREKCRDGRLNQGGIGLTGPATYRLGSSKLQQNQRLLSGGPGRFFFPARELAGCSRLLSGFCGLLSGSCAGEEYRNNRSLCSRGRRISFRVFLLGFLVGLVLFSCYALARFCGFLARSFAGMCASLARCLVEGILPLRFFLGPLMGVGKRLSQCPVFAF